MPDRVVVLIADLDYPGGMERKVGRLARALARERDVVVVTWGKARETSDPLRAIDVVRIPTLTSWRTPPAGIGGRVRNGVSLALALVAVVARRRPKVLYAAGLFPEGVVAALAGRVLRRPFVLDTWLSGPHGNVANLQRGATAPALRRLLARAGAAVVETEETAAELHTIGIDDSRIYLIPNGVELDRFPVVTESVRASARAELGLADAAGVVVYAGRFDVRQKRLDLLLEAWSSAGLSGWRLVLVGDGPDADRVMRHAQTLRPEPVLAGWHDDVRPFYAAADAFVLPTDFEGQPAALFEGMASGLPGVVSTLPAFERLAPPGVTLVENDVADWVAALREIAADGVVRAARGRAARQWVERHHDWTATVDAYTRVLGLSTSDEAT